MSRYPPGCENFWNEAVQGVEGKYGEGLTLALIGFWVTKPMRKHNLIISVPLSSPDFFPTPKLPPRLAVSMVTLTKT